MIAVLRTTSPMFGKYSWSSMTRPGRGGRTDRTWINSAVSELEVVCTTAPSETYRTGMMNLGGRGSGWSWCGVSDIPVTSTPIWCPPIIDRATSSTAPSAGTVTPLPPGGSGPGGGEDRFELAHIREAQTKRHLRDGA